LKFTIKNSLFLGLILAPVLYSCTTGPANNGNPSSSPTAAQPVVTGTPTASPVPTSTPLPTPVPTITASAQPTSTPVPTATPTSVVVVDTDNSTGVYELRSHKTGDAETYLAICESNNNIVATQSDKKFPNEISFNPENDYVGSKSLFDGKTFHIDLTQKINQEHPQTTFTEWHYSYKEGRMFDVRYVIKNFSEEGFDPVLLSNSFKKLDTTGKFVETCNNSVK
jgi:hypothetical protein